MSRSCDNKIFLLKIVNSVRKEKLKTHLAHRLAIFFTRNIYKIAAGKDKIPP